MSGDPKTTIILPDGKPANVERRAHPTYRPYRKSDGTNKDTPKSAQSDRRKKPRYTAPKGVIIDLEE